MAKLAKYFSLPVLLLIFALVSPEPVRAEVDPSIEGEKTEKAAKKPDEAVKKTEKDELKPDSVEQVSTNPEDGAKNTSEKTQQLKKKESSGTMLSYNFVFYLMYKFKIEEIFNLSDKKNQSELIDSDALLLKSKQWIVDKIQRIEF